MATLNYGKAILREMMLRVIPRNLFVGNRLANMSISDFRKKKLLYVFHKICSLRGWQQGSPQYQKTFDSMILIWEGLRSRADFNQDGQVSETASRKMAHTVATHTSFFYYQSASVCYNPYIVG
ncbi:hypothetical protein HUJ04_003314 [Dendroctonus ponderosae]|nr:hypothetical protein HUJ04_003314 [Dendroctonus ponderosae]KAH0998901.1 hypothetical protein HUJ04_003314 [Dendroctonus ponderosae]